ncbi:MAG: RNA-binding protein [Chitinophagaceae bacterium]
MTIQIFNLSHNISDKDLHRMFRSYGLVDSAVVSRNSLNGRSNGKALIEMPIDKEAKTAILCLHHTLVDGKKISVSEYRSLD